MSILEVQDLKKSFGKKPVIKGLNFTMEEGEILGILGPNGAGKTTTLQMLLGVLTPTSGEIRIFGEDLSEHKSAILERMNFSSTYTDLPWRLTVRENLTWTSWLYSLPDRNRRLAKISAIFRLEKIWKQTYGSLSAGQRTRVNLARSMVNFPKLLLLDEPTASLDPEVAAYMREFFASQREKFNTSIILTSHNMSEVEELCDRVIVLKDGMIIGNDTPDRLAKQIEICRLTLKITKNSATLEKLAAFRRHSFVKDAGVYTITLKERQLPLFLYELTKKNIGYSEISIEKPTLEDYFLKIAKRSSDETV